MLYWTIKSQLTEYGGVAASAVGIALAMLLAIYLDAVFRGEANQIVAFIERSPGDVWVLQDGVENLHMARSRLSENTIAEVRGIPGVESLIKMVYRDAMVGESGQEKLVYVVGVPFDPDSKAAWQKRTQWIGPKEGSVIIPEPMAAGAQLRIGDAITIGGKFYSIEGFSSGTYSMANPLVFMNERDARRQFKISDGANLLLVDVKEGIDPVDLAARIEERSDNARALPKSLLIENDYQLALQMGGALIGMMSLIGTIVAIIIVIFSAYAFVSARSPELAVAKALGAPQSQLIISAALQTGVVALLGIIFAFTAIWPLESVLQSWVPDVQVDFSAFTTLKLSAAVFIAAELAALVPVTYIMRVDPALVFKG